MLNISLETVMWLNKGKQVNVWTLAADKALHISVSGADLCANGIVMALYSRPLPALTRELDL